MGWGYYYCFLFCCCCCCLFVWLFSWLIFLFNLTFVKFLWRYIVDILKIYITFILKFNSCTAFFFFLFCFVLFFNVVKSCKFILTGNPMYSGHQRDRHNVSAIDRCSLYRGLTKSLLKSQQNPISRTVVFP